MTTAHPAGKGSRPRPYSPIAYGAGWDRIFGSKKKAGRSRKNEKRKKKENQMNENETITAEYHPTNPAWPKVLKIRLANADCGYVWTAEDAGNGQKELTVAAAGIAPRKKYATIKNAIAAAKRHGFIVKED